MIQDGPLLSESTDKMRSFLDELEEIDKGRDDEQQEA